MRVNPVADGAMARAGMLMEKIALSILARDGIAAIWRLHAGEAERLGGLSFWRAEV